MPMKITAGALLSAAFIILVAAISPVSAATDDACSLLTTAQVTDAVGIPMKAGTYVTPEFKKTCTWTPSGDAKTIRAVTLFLETAEAYASGKAQLEQALAVMKTTNPDEAKHMENSAVSGIGDDAFSLTVGPTVGLMVKKGTAAFKVEIYAELPTEKKLEMEKTLARAVVPKL